MASNIDNSVDAASTPNTSPDPQVSEAQLHANKQNAQQSSGARTQAGRQASSMNALKHGLTAVAACLPSDNAADYQDLVASHFQRHSPLGDEECEVVQLIADNAWRLHKVTLREAAIFDLGRTEYSGIIIKRNRRQPVPPRHGRSVKRAFQIAEACLRQKIPFNPAEFGFVFTTAEWNDYAKRSDRYYVLTKEQLNLNKSLAEYRASQVESKVA
jgi:hypothetical protein